jgi:hypothetical protein
VVNQIQKSAPWGEAVSVRSRGGDGGELDAGAFEERGTAEMLERSGRRGARASLLGSILKWAAGLLGVSGCPPGDREGVESRKGMGRIHRRWPTMGGGGGSI